jgi:hypothetical protein
MIMKRKLLWMVAGAIGIGLTGCMASPAGIAPSTVPITSADSYTIVRRDVEGTDTGVFLLGLPLTSAASGYDALLDAKEKSGADALINVTAENRYTYFLLLLWWEEVSIKGDAIRFKMGGEHLP